MVLAIPSIGSVPGQITTKEERQKWVPQQQIMTSVPCPQATVMLTKDTSGVSPGESHGIFSQRSGCDPLISTAAERISDKRQQILDDRTEKQMRLDSQRTEKKQSEAAKAAACALLSLNNGPEDLQVMTMEVPYH